MQATTKPRLRPVDTRWVEHNGQPTLLLRDPLSLSQQSLLVPPSLMMLLGLCDGTRDLRALRAAFSLQTGIELTTSQLQQIVGQLDEALLLESPRFAQIRDTAIAAFREAPCRPSALAGKGYPSYPAALRSLLDSYVAAAFDGQEPPRANGDVCGLISPHIDYQRGGPVYAQAWRPAVSSLRSADLVIVFGTDHAGAPGQLTFTRQHYATPWGLLPTARSVVDAIAEAIGEEEAFAAELHHRQEHSIELATVWLHYVLGDIKCELVPILCGSFHHFVEGQADPASDERFKRVLDVLRDAAGTHRTVLVAAADLAHVGPAFGDEQPFGVAEQDTLRDADHVLLSTAITGAAESFLTQIREERDGRRICGLPPIYLMLRLLDGARGEVTGYAQCPADSDRSSWVTVGGVIYRRD